MFFLYYIKYTASLILSPFELAYRFHSNISRYPWARIWYAIRALDVCGRGYYEIPLQLLSAICDRSEKSIYQLLKIGKKHGAFRKYSVRRGILHVWLGGLFAVCRKLNLKNWGTVATANLLHLNNLRPLTTAATAQKLQQSARYAVNSQLKPDYRKIYGAPSPNELVPHQPSTKSATGEIPFVLHVSETRIFCSKSFAAYGVSQHSIAMNLAIHPRTVQRHLAAVEMASRQLCQTKTEYPQLYRSLENEATESWGTVEGKFTDVGYQTIGDKVIFSDGRLKGAKKQRTNTYQLRGNLGDRLFRVGKKYFLAKCNIYREQLTLKAMWRRRKQYRDAISCNCHSDTFEKIEPSQGADVKSILPKPPGI